MQVSRLWLLALILAGCGVKARPPETQTLTTLSAGLEISRQAGYVLKATPLKLLPGEENTVTFQVVDSNFAPVDLSKVKITIQYIMPSMPQMGVFRSEAKVLGPGRFEAVFDIVHGGDWRLTVGLGEDGAIFNYDVK